MNIQIELWQLVSLLLGFFSACAMAGKMLLSQSQRALDQQFRAVSERLQSIESGQREEASQWLRVERELNALKVDLPREYVRREDYIRGQSVLESKFDGLALKIEKAMLQGAFNGGKNAD